MYGIVLEGEVEISEQSQQWTLQFRLSQEIATDSTMCIYSHIPRPTVNCIYPQIAHCIYSQIPTDNTLSDSKLHIYPQIGHNIIKDTHRCPNSYPSLGISIPVVWFGIEFDVELLLVICGVCGIGGVREFCVEIDFRILR